MSSSTTITGVVLGATLLSGAGLAGSAAAGGAAGAPVGASAQRTSGTHATRHDQLRLAGSWVRLWNGDYSLADRLISPALRVHAALLDGGDGSAIKGPGGMVDMVTQIRSAFPDLRFAVQVGPIIDRNHIVVRWVATGTYGGGFPGAAAPEGTSVTFEGTDVLRTERGQIREYWLNADTRGLLAQLQVQGG